MTEGPGQARRRGRRIGVLGGSFNPAHEGHLHISRLALRLLRLDAVWWMVSPQNPLKEVRGMAAFETRIAGARAMARHPRIRVTGIEAEFGTAYTADTLKALRKRFPKDGFVWLMGADNLAQIGRWRQWTAIFHTVPVAVFARPHYSLRALAGKAAHRFKAARVAEQRAGALAGMSPPAWVFLNTRLDATSATGIRAGLRRSGRSAVGK